MLKLSKGMKIKVSRMKEEHRNRTYCVLRGGPMTALAFASPKSDTIGLFLCPSLFLNSETVTVLTDDEARQTFDPRLADFCGLNSEHAFEIPPALERVIERNIVATLDKALHWHPKHTVRHGPIRQM